MKAFKNEKDLFKYYFEHRFKQNDIVFNDARLLDKPLLNNCMNTKMCLYFIIATSMAIILNLHTKLHWKILIK